MLAAAFGVIMNSVYAVIHEAEHRMLFANRRVNDAAGVVMALFFPAPFHLLRQGHLGHHLRNRSDDEAFDLYFDGEHPIWKRLQLYGILTGFYWLVAVLANVVVLVFPFVLRREHFEFDRPSAAFMDALNPRYRPIIRLEAIAVIALHTRDRWTLGIPLLTYAVMYAGFGVSWSAMQYVHHFGTTRHVLEGARNLWIWAPHRSAVAESQLAPHASQAPDGALDSSAATRPPREPRSRVPAGVLPAKMWRGPQRATDRVENRYAGRVIR